MNKATAIKFCTHVGCIKLQSSDDNLPLNWAWLRSHDLLKFWEISTNISKMVQDRNIVMMEDL